MNKIIGLCLVVMLLVAFCSCGRGEEDDGKALLTADSTINVTSNAGVITLNEDVVAIMLGVFSPEHLGLSDTIDNYDIKIGATKVFGNDACLVEAYTEGSDTPEGIFAILGKECYVYKDNQYMLLTVNGPIEVTNVPTVTVSPNESAGDETGTNNTDSQTEITDESQLVTTEPQTYAQLSSGMQYNAENDKKLKEKFSSYSKETLGIEKELSEYILVATGNSTTVLEGETFYKVYIVYLYEQDGTKTNFKLAITDDSAYKFNEANSQFEKLN